MKILFATVSVLFFFLFPTLNLNAQQGGKALFDTDWQFHKGDMQLQQAIARDSSWRKVTLPHDWSIEGPFNGKWASGTGFLPGGIGWYRKQFDVSNWSKELHYFIYFDGIYKNSEVWLNGHFLGKRPNGFIPIQYDLTPYLKPAYNILAVRVDHSDFADSRFYTGSGIYRDVYLITKNEQYFEKWGIFFETSKITESQADTHVSIAYKNASSERQNLQINTVIKDQNGAIVSKIAQNVQISPDTTGNLKIDLNIDKPHLWSINDPYLYDLEISMLSKCKEIDSWHDKVGVRNFKFTADEGFFLNGKNLLLKGVCIHQDAGALGAAVPEEVWRSRLRTLKDLGCNAIRMSHYPHQNYLYDLCDEMGFLVQDEAFDEWEVGKN